MWKKKIAMIYTARKNRFGNYVNEETGFVFCRITQAVYGRQDKSGIVFRLTSRDYDKCMDIGFSVDTGRPLPKRRIFSRIANLRFGNILAVITTNTIIPDLLTIIHKP